MVHQESGKTTLVDILLGLLKPQSGKIEFNGCPLENNLEKWRSQVAYLPQQVFLIDNSLSGNVALGEEAIEIDEIRQQEALRRARLKRTGGTTTPRSEHCSGRRRGPPLWRTTPRGRHRSCLYHGRSVLVMDETTSALDNETERDC